MSQSMNIILFEPSIDLKLIIPIIQSHMPQCTDFSSFYEECADSSANRLLFLGSLDNIFVAMTQIILTNADDDPDLADGDKVAHIHNLRVHNDYLRQGLARQLIQFIEEYCKQLGKEVLTLGVDSWNLTAIQLYESLAYKKFKVEDGRIPEEKVICMKKRLVSIS